MHHPRNVRILCGLLLPLLAALGCDRSGPEAARALPVASLLAGSQFDPTTAGDIQGRVTWAGDVPAPPPFEVWSMVQASDGSRERRLEPNPNAPRIAANRGVGNAVVFLRGVNPVRGRPWDHAPVRIELRDRQAHVLQGAVDSPYGFVHRGEQVEMVSREPVFHSLHGSGAAFFTLAFPDPDDPCARRFPDPGIVELTSAAGHYAMRAYLFVDDGTYYARTDTNGGFVLPRVPPGQYEVVCWMPSWIAARHERDPETALIFRLFFNPPVERIRTVMVEPGQSLDLSFQFSAADFAR